MTYARIHLDAAVDTLVAELDWLVGRICRHDPVLDLRFEEGSRWRVYDVANFDQAMRSTDRLTEAQQWASAHIAKHGGRLGDGWAEAEENDSHSRAVPSNVIPLRGVTA